MTVDTIDPVSTKQGTSTAPMSTFKWGQDEIKVASSTTTPEPVIAPPELWLCNAAGASFPTADEAAYQTAEVGRVKKAEGEGAHASLHTPWRSDLAVGTADRLWGRKGKDGGVAENAASRRCSE